MSVISQLSSALPVVQCAKWVYKAANHDFSWTETKFHRITWVTTTETFNKSHPNYASRLQSLPGARVKQCMESFLNAEKIRKDLIVYVDNHGELAKGFGTNLFSKGDAVIMMSRQLYDADQDAFFMVFKHEVSHIKYNDTFTIPCVLLMCMFAKFMFFYMNPAEISTQRVVLLDVASCAMMCLFSQWREAKADDFAISHSTDEELQGGRRFFSALRQKGMEMRNTSWSRRLIISPQGEMRLDVFHPSLAGRIQKVENALRQRNVVVQENLVLEQRIQGCIQLGIGQYHL